MWGFQIFTIHDSAFLLQFFTLFNSGLTEFMAMTTKIKGELIYFQWTWSSNANDPTENTHYVSQWLK